MKIAVLVKQVPGSESPLPISASQDWLEESGVAYVMNESDNYAIEEALQICEKNGDGVFRYRKPKCIRLIVIEIYQHTKENIF